MKKIAGLLTYVAMLLIIIAFTFLDKPALVAMFAIFLFASLLVDIAIGIASLRVDLWEIHKNNMECVKAAANDWQTYMDRTEKRANIQTPK
jgi:ABC-type multidrug transport system permease subunit